MKSRRFLESWRKQSNADRQFVSFQGLTLKTDRGFSSPDSKHTSKKTKKKTITYIDTTHRSAFFSRFSTALLGKIANECILIFGFLDVVRKLWSWVLN